MRKKGLILLGIAALLCFLLPYLFLDSWLEKSLEEYGSSANVAKVEIDDLSLSFLHPSLKWSRLQIADRRKPLINTLETDECELSFNLLPLLQGKFLADELKVQGLAFNTLRSNSGALESQRTDTGSAEAVQANAEQGSWPAKLFRKINTDSLLAAVELTSPQKLDSLKQAFGSSLQSWQQELRQLPDAAEIDSARSELKGIRLKDIKTLEDAKAALDRISKLYKKLEKNRNTVTLLKKEVQQKYAELRDLPDAVRDWTEADYQSLKQFSGETFSRESVTTLLLGPEIAEKIGRAEKIVRRLRQVYQKFHRRRPSKEKPPRGRGQIFHFSDSGSLPKVWIRRIELSGSVGAGRSFAGQVTDLTTNQNFVAKATKCFIAGLQDADTSLSFSAELDYRGKQKRETARLSLIGLVLKGKEFAGGRLLPHRLAGGSADLTAQFDFEGDDYMHSIDFSGSNIEFDFSTLDLTETDANLQNMIRETASALKNIRLQAISRKKGADRSLTITSNVDNIVAARLGKIIGGRTGELDQAIEQRIQSNREKYQTVIYSISASFKADALDPVSARDADLKELEKLLKEKRAELEQQLTKKQGDLLKSLFH